MNRAAVILYKLERLLTYIKCQQPDSYQIHIISLTSYFYKFIDIDYKDRRPSYRNFNWVRNIYAGSPCNG